MNLNVRKPCKNCPFRKQGAIELRPGRVDAIARDLIADDTATFPCHKTLHLSVERPQRERSTVLERGPARGMDESACAGAMVFLLAAGQPNVAMRLGAALKMLSIEDLEQQIPDVIEPNSLDLAARPREVAQRRKARRAPV